MKHRQFGRTGVMVTPLCMGTMTFGWKPDDWGSTKEVGFEVGKRALDLGINFFDTANVYDRGGCEEVTGKVLKGKRDRVRGFRSKRPKGPSQPFRRLQSPPSAQPPATRKAAR